MKPGQANSILRDEIKEKNHKNIYGLTILINY